MSIKKITMFVILSLILIVSGASFVSAVTLSGSDLILAESGASGEISITLSDIPDGLSGFDLTIGIVPSGIAEITSVKFPDVFDGLKQVSSLPNSEANVISVDLTDAVKAGATLVPLCTLTVNGLTDGTGSILITIGELTDDSGNPIEAEIGVSKITVGSNITESLNITPTIEPTVIPTKVPTDVSNISPNITPTIEPTVIPTKAPSDVSNVSPIVNPNVTPTVMPVPTNKPSQLVSNFSADKQVGNPPFVVQFYDNSTGNPTKWWWNFGDGSFSKLQNPVHVYGGIGRYTVTLEVENWSNQSIERKIEFIKTVKEQLR